MKLLIKSATLVDNASDLNFKVKDILIEDGVITEISDKIESKADKIIKHKIFMYQKVGLTHQSLLANQVMKREKILIMDFLLLHQVVLLLFY